MNGLIRTVTGDIPASGLGFTQSHEHILLRKGKSFEVNPVLWQDDPQKSLLELTDYRHAGGEAIVDAQPVGCSRMAMELEEISRSSGVKIIASTGFHKLVFYPENHWIQTMPGDELAALFVSELTEGMFEDGDDALPAQRTPVRAGQIKTAYDTCLMTGRYRQLFRAAAAAGKATGAPVMIHVEIGTDPRPVLDFLLEEGLPAERLIFCHLDRACADPDIHLQILKAGAWLEYDTIGRYKYRSDEEEIGILSRMIREGFGRQLLFSLDTTRARLGRYGGDISLTYLIESFLPKMRAAGIRDKSINNLSIENPARAFIWRG